MPDLFVVYAGTSEDSYQEVIDLILKEFKRLKTDPFKNGELETAKEHLKGNLLLSLESSDSLMTRLAKNEIYFDTYLPVEQILAGIDGVKEEEVRYLASELFDDRYFCLTMLGPMDGDGLVRRTCWIHGKSDHSNQTTEKRAIHTLPQYMTEGASGMDLFACLEKEVTLAPGERKADSDRNLRGNSGRVRRPGETPKRPGHPEWDWCGERAGHDRCRLSGRDRRPPDQLWGRVFHDPGRRSDCPDGHLSRLSGDLGRSGRSSLHPETRGRIWPHRPIRRVKKRRGIHSSRGSLSLCFFFLATSSGNDVGSISSLPHR